MNTTTIRLPHLYTTSDRPYQDDFWDAFHSAGRHRGKKYRLFVKVWHRRGGKDMTDWNAAIERVAEQPMTAKYAFPTSDMARDNLWESVTNDGLAFTDFIPLELRVRKHKNDDGLNNSLKNIDFINGSSLRVISAHKPDRLRGGNSKLFGISEFQAQDPRVIDIIMPILRMNGGVALINMTANGDSAAKVLLEYWKTQEDVYVSEVTIEDSGLLSPREMDQIFEETIAMFRARGQSEEEAIAFVRQEYYCDWSAPVIGSYFGTAMKYAEEEGRIGNVPYDSQLPVFTYWDLGIDDSMSIWFAQFVGSEIRLIDYYENSGEGFNHYAKVLRGQEKAYERMRQYTYGKPGLTGHYAPHDIKVRNMGKEAETRLAVAKKSGIEFEAVKRVGKKEEGIEAIRSVLSRCYFDKTRCARGISALKGYRKDYNAELQVYYDKPVHDWTSHGTDAFQTMAIRNQQPMQERQGGRIVKTGGRLHIPTVVALPDGGQILTAPPRNIDPRRQYAQWHRLHNRTTRR